jgi:hypothetical protein
MAASTPDFPSVKKFFLFLFRLITNKKSSLYLQQQTASASHRHG